ncbi:CD44 antigen isoform X3 [Columba livia]|uniref:CD44 antigen n=1 Tax=Columba livia TaxID=8932 RepID=A0A2I0MNI7_COLLI|nr:CD44 antigen isoform X3 [Columba livia]PKK31243.1 CD44 molecule (Indian blood group), transcript variant X3 [Columba livia]
MANFFLSATFGLCLLKLCLTETQFNVSCRYGGVFHVEKNGRYTLTRSEAVELCRALNSTLSTLEQLKKAHELGFETCRYGFVVGNIVIPRINPYHLCAANHTGIYKLSANTTGRYDAYCYNATETRDKACEPIERLDTSFLNHQGEIVIDNADGSRYDADGTRHSGESSTSGADDENVGSGSTHDTTPMDTSIRRSSPSYYASAIPVSELPGHSSGGDEKEIPRKDSGSTSSIYGNQGPHKGLYESTAFPGETTTTKIVPQSRSAQVPDWLIIVAALVALALILAVCIAVNSRRRCGQKKKLVINNGKGAVEDRKTSGLNGGASKSQEMVHLVHREQSSDRTGACDEFLTTDETQNHQELDMKSGV